ALTIPLSVLTPAFLKYVVLLRDSIEADDVSVKKGKAVKEERAMPDGHYVYDWLLASLEGSKTLPVPDWPVFCHPVSPVAVYDGHVCRKSMVLYAVETLCRVCIQLSGQEDLSPTLEPTLNHIMVRFRAHVVRVATASLSAKHLFTYGREWERQLRLEISGLTTVRAFSKESTAAMGSSACDLLLTHMGDTWSAYIADESSETHDIASVLGADYPSHIGHHMPEVDEFIASSDSHVPLTGSSEAPPAPECIRRALDSHPTPSSIVDILPHLHDLFHACLEGGAFATFLEGDVKSAAGYDNHIHSLASASEWLCSLSLPSLIKRDIHIQSMTLLTLYAVTMYCHKASCERDRVHGKGVIETGRLSVDTTPLHSLVQCSAEELWLMREVERYFYGWAERAHKGNVLGTGKEDVPRLYASSNRAMQQYISQLEEDYKRAKRAKREEVEQAKREYARLQVVSRGPCSCTYRTTRYGRETTSTCARCLATARMDGMKIPVVEDPLPESYFDQCVVAFFAKMPPFLQHMYQTLARLEMQFASSISGVGGKTYDWLLACDSRTMPLLRSTTKLFVDSHYRDRHVTARESAFFVPNGRQLTLMTRAGEYRNVQHTGKPPKYARVPHASTWNTDSVLSLQVAAPYECLQTSDLDTVWSTSHTQNEVLARQCDRSTSLDPSEFVTYGSIRAGGHLQVRNVLNAVAYRSLSFEEQPVADLVRMAIMQAGPPQSGSTCLREWHQDWTDPVTVASMVHHLTRLLESVSENWSQLRVMESVIAVGKVMRACGNVTEGDQILESCHTTCLRWLDAMVKTEQALDMDGEESDESAKVRLKISRVGAFAISALEGLPFSRHRTMTYLSLLACLRDNTHLGPKIQNPEFVADAYRVSLSLHPRVCAELQADPSILPEFVNSHWQGAGGRLPVFTLHSGDADRYWWARYGEVCVQFDTLFGNFLVDGYPSNRLPDTITSGPVYRRTFGDTVLTVHRATSRSYVTATPHRGLVFYFNVNGSIHMTERGNRWLLIPHTLLAPHMAHMLTAKYSHWLCVSAGPQCVHGGRILFRPVSILAEDEKDRDVLPDYHMVPPSAPHPLLSQPAWRLIKNDGRHVVSSTSSAFQHAMDIFKYLDASPYCILYCDADGRGTAVSSVDSHPTICLERLGVNFSVRETFLQSVEFPSLLVDPRISPVPVLLGLESKLVLSDIHGVPQKYLVPHGTVVPHKAHDSACHHSCSVSLDGRGSSPPVFCFDVRSGLKCLESPAQCYVPYLALLHGMTASPMREPFTECTGSEMAVIYLRRCWSNAPYPAETVSILSQVADIAPDRGVYPPHKSLFERIEWKHSGALAPVCAHDVLTLLCHALSCSSERLSVLYLKQAHGVGDLNPMAVCSYMRDAPRLPPSLRLTDEEIQVCGGLHTTTNVSSAKNHQNAEARVRQAAVHYWQGDMPPLDVYGELTQSSYSWPIADLDASLLACDFTPFASMHCASSHLAVALRTARVTGVSAEEMYYAANYLNYRAGDTHPILTAAVPFVSGMVRAVALQNGIRTSTPLPSWNGVLQSWSTDTPVVYERTSNRRVSRYYPEENRECVRRANQCIAKWTRHYVLCMSQAGRPLYNCFSPKERYPINSWFEIIEGIAERFVINIAMHAFATDIVTAVREKVPMAPRLSTNFTLAPVSHSVTTHLVDLTHVSRSTPSPVRRQTPDALEVESYHTGRWPDVDVLFDQCLARRDAESVTNVTRFPLEADSDDHSDVLSLPMGQEILSDLEVSWQKSATQVYNSGYVLAPTDTVLSALETACAVTGEAVERVWHGLRSLFSPTLTGTMVSVTPLTVVPLLFRPDTDESLKVAICHYLNVCVYHSKACRCRDTMLAIHTPTSDGKHQDPGSIAHLSGKLVTDLLTRHGAWSPEEYPEYLVFEAERGVTIRDHQAEIAEEMRAKDGGNAVLQLKNGEGKTSVVIPLLCATVSGQDPTHSTLPRVTVLSSLYDTNLANLQLWMGGLLGKRVLTFPVCRDVDFTEEAGGVILSQLESAMERGDTVLTVPEHRLSFMLKAREQHINGNTATAASLSRVVEWHQQHSFDLLDECDTLLSHVFQLVYACGLQMPMDGDKLRWEMAQVVLSAVQKCCPTLLDGEYGGAFVADRTKRKGQWCGLRIAKRSEAVVHTLISTLSEHLLATMPVFRQFCGTDRAILHSIITGTHDLSPLDASPLETVRDIALILRGLLHHEVLWAALEKRWSVEYGVDTETLRRLMAVPFRAKDTPSARSDFAHVDVAILMTHISYYNTGLGRKQFYHTLQRLCEQCNPQDRWREWVRALRKAAVKAAPKEIGAVLADVSNVNLADVAQTNKLYQLFRYNMPTVDFYLANFVLPAETKQFPQRLTASAWDLVNSEQCTHPVRGFSGTNDNGPTLPLGVSQTPLDSLVHTNGTVMRHILHKDNERYALIPPDAPLEMLALIQTSGCRCLIDCGAQMIALSNRQVAETWLGMTGTDIEAAVYFADGNRLMALNKQGITAPFLASPYYTQLHRCIVYIDDHHSRGTDLKMPSWRAALTLGPRLTKAKLVQSAMRMRQLGHGQCLTFLVPAEVDAELREVAGKRRVRSRKKRTTLSVTRHGREVHRPASLASKYTGTPSHPLPVDILRWCVANTCREQQRHMVLWAGQGLNHAQGEAVSAQVRRAHSTGAPLTPIYQQYLLDEQHSLSDMYGSRRDRHAGSQVVRAKCKVASNKCRERLSALGQNGDSSPDFDSVKRGIEARADAYLQRVVSAATTLDEEQERELEQEREEEREEDRPGPATPCVPSRLRSDVLMFIETGTVREASKCIQNVSASLAGTSVPVPNRSVWSDRLLCTSYFRHTVKEGGLLDSYLRPVSHIVYHPGSSTALLVSPWEANAILERCLLGVDNSDCILLQHSARLSTKAPLLAQTKAPLPAQTGLGKGCEGVDPTVFSQLSLFSGSLYHGGSEMERTKWAAFLGVCSLGLVTDDVVQGLVDSGRVDRMLKFALREVAGSVKSEEGDDGSRALALALRTRFESGQEMHTYIQALLVVSGVFYRVAGSHIGDVVFRFM
ncbi:protein of unknown function DUF3645, partial [Kipferlia bialata]